MIFEIELISYYPNKKYQLEMKTEPPKFNAATISEDEVLFEDAHYSAAINFSELDLKLQTLNVYINGQKAGEGLVSGHPVSRIEISFPDIEKAERYPQPFLLQYDLIILSVVLEFADGTCKEWFSDYMLCVSKHEEDSRNIETIIKELMDFDDSQINEWLLSGRNNVSSALMDGMLRKNSYKSLSSYIQLIEEIQIKYRELFPIFRTSAKNVISKENKLLSYEKVRRISIRDMDWLMQNSQSLSPIGIPTGINYNGDYYLPKRMQTESQEKNWDVYENQIIIGFLHEVHQNTRVIIDKFNNSIDNEEAVLKKLKQAVTGEYKAPIITIKQLQISYSRILLTKLRNIVQQQGALLQLYMDAIPCSLIKLYHLPKKTKIFQEVIPYSKIFDLIIKWYHYGEFSLLKENIVLQVKTLDKLFEYYCLYRLLKMLTNVGFRASTKAFPAFSYKYDVPDNLYYPEMDVANTFNLESSRWDVTVYYQPVIYNKKCENGLTIFKTTDNTNYETAYSKKNAPYYTPDFILKFISSDNSVNYIILDSKFSSRKNIAKYTFDKVVSRYANQLSVTHEGSANSISMVWILQGRMDKFEQPIWRYHNSFLAQRNMPPQTYGIASVNTYDSTLMYLWKEIEASLA